MDVDEYDRTYAVAVEEAETAHLAQGLGADGPDEELLGTVAATSGETDTRVAAIDQIRFNAVAYPAVIELLLTVLGDTGDDPVVRRAALGALAESSFRVVDFGPHATDYRAILRSVATDADLTLRERALEFLALAKDEYAQRLLLDGLRDPKKALVAARRALQMVGHDLHAEHYDLLRDIVASSEHQGIRNDALRLLAADGDSKDLFARIVQDASQDTEARSTSAIALSSLAPEEFASIAQDIVLDEDDDDDLRATCLTTLAHGPGPSAEPDLAARVLDTPTAKSAELTRAAHQYTRTMAPGNG